MKFHSFFLIVLALLIITSQSLWAQKDVISVADFKQMVKENADLVILDANKSKGYQAAHIKNAIFINHNDLYQDGEIKGLIKSPEELAVIFGELGVGGDRPVVITDDGSQKYSSRVYWILKYLGYDNAVLLHKDKKAWAAARLALTAEPGKANPTTFTVEVQPEIYANIDDVSIAQDNPMKVLVDARTNEEFIGDHKNSEGHIPGAINLNHLNLLTDSGAFKSKAEIEKIANELGLTPDKELIFYCRTSVRAGVPYFAFANILGYEKLKVYDGAYLEWSANKDVVQ